MIDNQDWTLIHGTLNVSDLLGKTDKKYRQYGHAWAEKDEYVFDPAHNCFYSKQYFEKSFKAKTIKRYSLRETSKLILKMNHSGPWHG